MTSIVNDEPLLFTQGEQHQDQLRDKLNDAYRLDENTAIETVLNFIDLDAEARQKIHDVAYRLVEQLRRTRLRRGGLDTLLSTYDLSTTEGIALLCIAEAILRIPDNNTIDNLLHDKLTRTDWQRVLGKSDSLFVNATTWVLMLTGEILGGGAQQNENLSTTIKRLLRRTSEPVIRQAVAQAMKILARQFVIGQNITQALQHASRDWRKGYSHSFDMLGEAARTDADAERYYQAYITAIKVIGTKANRLVLSNRPGISIKLSALYPRYEFAQQDTAIPLLTTRLLKLARLAKQHAIDLTVDAEEANRLDISLAIIKPVFMHTDLADWQGFGLAVQAYQKRAFYLIDWLQQMSIEAGKRLVVRLVKGAYWDSEIKLSQELGLADYPVFTRKVNTDVSYIACAQKLLMAPQHFYPRFATHNPHTVATILQMTTQNQAIEFQCLHGMGHSLYDHLLQQYKDKVRCRIYAPVGCHQELLPYLVRRLLENGANTSFVHRIMDKRLSIEEIIVDPLQQATQPEDKKHPKIPLPLAIYGNGRINSRGIDLTNRRECGALVVAMRTAREKKWCAKPTIITLKQSGETQTIYDPAFAKRIVGTVINADPQMIDNAITQTTLAASAWDACDVTERAQVLQKMADLLEQQRADFIYLAVREAGKTISDALAEVREAIDFCRYYALQARQHLAAPQLLTGATGEQNQLAYHGRGVFVCISPWNFPLAIFTGQVAAALVAGNAVIAKPAEQTPLMASAAVNLFYQAGLPKEVLVLLPGSGEDIGAKLVADERIDGVMFTGSTQVAKSIQRCLAQKAGAIVPLIAETGGQNAMLVDSSALPEQVVNDVIISAFGSAGQRCSALRVLFLQEDIADNIITMLKGAMAKLKLGDPALLTTDVGPVIDSKAQAILQRHIEHMSTVAHLVYQTPMTKNCVTGHFVAPTVFAIDNIGQLQHEVFGPILHIVRFKIENLAAVLDEIKATGYGLTLGIYSRIQERVKFIYTRLRIGNVYVNRNMIGAVVGVQPFGGEGLSGTGPKAGGPNYLQRLCVERTLTINTTAIGGNADLLSLYE